MYGCVVVVVCENDVGGFNFHTRTHTHTRVKARNNDRVFFLSTRFTSTYAHAHTKQKSTQIFFSQQFIRVAPPLIMMMQVIKHFPLSAMVVMIGGGFLVNDFPPANNLVFVARR